MVIAAIGHAVNCLLPLVHAYGFLLTGLVLSGLTSGTFYPLTLSFALRNIPLRFLPFTLALYAGLWMAPDTCGTTLYGWFAIIFRLGGCSGTWCRSLRSCCLIYRGIPASSPPPGRARRYGFAGFLYGSAGFLNVAALDQGQRLDWWRSGLFNALFFSGAFFFAVSIGRRLRSPNPLVDLPFLRRWNTIIYGLALILFGSAFCGDHPCPSVARFTDSGGSRIGLTMVGRSPAFCFWHLSLHCCFCKDSTRGC